MAYIFDGGAKIITLSAGTTAFDVDDMYSRWVDWIASNPANQAYLPAMRSVGGDAISDTKKLGMTFFMINGWRVRPDEANHTLHVNGNLYTDPAGFSPFVQTLGAFNVMIEMTVSSLVDSTTAQLPEIEQASFNGRVTIDVINGSGGTTYPIGTQQSPVNNLADAQTIAASRGFDEFYVLGNLTFIATDVISNQHFTGQGATLNVTKSLFTFIDGVTTANSHFHNARITGKQGGESNYHSCIIDGLWNAHCHYYECGFVRPTANLSYTVQHSNTAGVTHVTDLHNCYTDHIGAVIDRNGAKMNQVYIQLTGMITFINQNRPTESGSIWINMSGGTVTIDASCTTGSFHITGNCKVVNNSGGSIVDTTQVVTGWNDIAADYNTAGTMGNKLNTASAGGVDYQALADVIRAELEPELTHITTLQNGQGLDSTQATMLLEIYRLAGLDPTKPLIVTTSYRTAGAGIQQQIITNASQTTMQRV